MRRIGNIGALLALVLVVSAGISAGASATLYGVVSWGQGSSGQLGLGGGVGGIKTTPETLRQPADVTAVSAGLEHSLALQEGGVVWSWGANYWGQLGNGSTNQKGVAVEVKGLSEAATAVSAGGFHDLALLAGGKVETWGANQYGQLGDGTTSGPEKCPLTGEETKVSCATEAVAVSGLAGATAVSAGAYSSLALLSGGGIDAWGKNTHGQLGDGSTTDSDVPVEVKGLTEKATAIAAGCEFSLALLASGKVVAWGRNTHGQLGNETATDSDEPVEVKGLPEKVTAIAAGCEFSLALLEDGHVVAWGDNASGQLGDGNTTDSHKPVEVEGLEKAAEISAGGEHSVALLEDGEARAWGANGAGQLGDGTTESRDEPVAVAGLSEPLAAISAGYEHTLAVAEPGPVLTGLNHRNGPPSGGTKVTIEGDFLRDITAVKFGSTAATSWKVNSETEIEAVSPAGSGTVYVTVTGTLGAVRTSNPIGPTRFFYQATEAPEYGRCLEGEGSGEYLTGTCSEEGEEGAFGWLPGVALSHFTLSSGEVVLETVGKTKITCKSGSGEGEYKGTKEWANTSLKFTGCEMVGPKSKCNSAGASEGEVRASTLDALLGWRSVESGSTAIELLPASGTTFAEFSCGSTSIVIRGKVLAPPGNNNTMRIERTAKFEAKEGKQKIEAWEAGSNIHLEASISGGAYEEIGLTMSLTQTNEEKVEISTHE
ncbi:MAG TPA: IPT/TIG domain-containing protein [Solirubrobacteraceae bacterium]|nr:IPT/TIG domain-containing protein [Solirubrobacteraceae bacterium]